MKESNQGASKGKDLESMKEKNMMSKAACLRQAKTTDIKTA